MTSDDQPRTGGRLRPLRSVVARAAVSGITGVALGVALGGCASDDREVLDVYAAASLTDAFTAFEEAFEADNPEVDVRLNLAGSTTLQRQILDGADADVFAPADVALLTAVTNAAGSVDSGGPIDGADGPEAVYAANTLTLIVPGEDTVVASAADLADGDLLTARCAAGVPCGDATDAFLGAAELDLGAVTEEPNVRAVLTKVATGEADAGFVYVTDAATAADVTALALTAAPRVDYGLAVLTDDPAAAAFARYVHSAEAAAVLDELGFEVP